MFSIMQGVAYGNVLKTIPLLSDTVHRRVNLLADNIKIQLIDLVKGSPYYAIQLDESTNVAELLILEGRTTGYAVNKVLQQVVTMINFIKAHALNSPLFKIMCRREFGSEYENLLLHKEVRWLSRGKILQRVFDLR
ncbi:zinc finger BED domain-containing protein 5-like [Diabrotica undecimpunctata]|uniref:zinc finger BED domain-containing protein 5-like n=1 Tax=Diabrotica undecimpunctata TaxID=50387 RepID=UPI003B632C6E